MRKEKQITVRVDADKVKALDDIAIRNNVTRAWIMRRAIDRLLGNNVLPAKSVTADIDVR